MKKLFCSISILCLIFTACQKKPEESPCKNNILRTSFLHTPLNIDPRRTGDPISSCMAFMTFEGLTYLEPDGSCSNALAEKIDISEDNKTYTFYLREAKWTDGRPITAHDLEYSWKSVLDPDFPSICPYLYYSIKGAEKAKHGKISVEEIGVKALDDRTFQVQLEHPTPYFLTLTSFCAFFPIPKHVDIDNPEWFKTTDEHVICSGPYKIVSWRHDSEIYVEKNPTFWDSSNIKLKGIHISILGDQTTCLQMYEKGKLDWIGGTVSALSLDSLTTLYKEGKIKSGSAGNTVFISYNVNAAPFDNLNMRKAFSLAIDRKAITDHITQLAEQPATQVFPPALTNHQTQSLIPPESQLKQAHKLFETALAEMNKTRETLPKITLMFPSAEVYKKVGQALQEQWRHAFNIEVETNFCEMKVFFDRLKYKTYQIAEAAWWAQYVDPMNVLERFRYRNSNKNYPGWENTKYLSLLSQIETTNDIGQRAELLRAAEKVIIDEVPLSPVYHFKATYLEKPYVAGVEMSPISQVQFRKAYLKPDHQ